MHVAGVKKTMKQLGWILMAFHLLAFTSPQRDDLIEIKGFLNGRSEGSFTAQNQNRLYVLKSGTRAVVREVKHFNSGNYGLCLSLLNATDIPSNSDCVWAYFDVKNPALNLYSVSGNPSVRKQTIETWAKDGKTVRLKKATTPSQGQAAQTTRQTTAVVENKNPSRTDSKAVAQSVVQGIHQTNKSVSTAMGASHSEVCMDCSKPSLVSYETACKNDPKQNYLENTLSGILNQSSDSAFYQSPQKEVIRTACIQRNMQTFVSSREFYRTCSPQQLSGGTKAAKACLSENYVNITSKAFNLAADCLGDYVAGSESGKGQAALSIFSFMAQESGMHVNARSSTGAGGPGQMTGGAINAVNQDMRNIKRHLENSKNPNCSQTLARALKNPLSTRGASCDRIRLDDGNPMKSMAYAFAYQAINRRVLDNVVFDEALFGKVISDELPKTQKDRLMMELSAWSHNTGPAGMTGTRSRPGPLIAQLRSYASRRAQLKTKSDVDQFMTGLKDYMRRYAHPANSSASRVRETSNYYENIQKKMKMITQEAQSCLAN
ncbi:MAG: hypothetical protein ACAH59_00300 [Pseudobdellovibrionaceae bacterium]